jgi:hypothetical protein
MHVVDVLGATSVVDGRLVYTSLSRDGATDVLSSSAIRIRFDRLLHPSSATRQAICLQPVLKQVTTIADCVAGIFLQPAYDPVRREVVFRHPPGQHLTPGLVYELTAYSPLSVVDAGFRSFEGTPLAGVERFSFGVQPDADPPPPRDDIPTDDRYCTSAAPGCLPTCNAACDDACGSDEACLGSCVDGCASTCPRSIHDILGKSGCSYASCHGGQEPAAGLDMRSGASLLATAIGHAAHGTQTGGGARVPDQNPASFGRAMPLIDREAPGNSYLLYKLLASPATPLEVPFPAGSAELQRIRSTLISGSPMPPSHAFTARLRPSEIEWISDWIFQGAPVAESCF